MPDKLAQLQFTLKARVENLAAGKKQDLTDQAAFALNQIDKTLKLENVHLARLAGGYVLDVLGKNGEVKPDRAVSVQLKHRDFKSAHSVSLKSDPAGRVRLGSLADIQWIKATNSDGTAYHWEISQRPPRAHCAALSDPCGHRRHHPGGADRAVE